MIQFYDRLRRILLSCLVGMDRGNLAEDNDQYKEYLRSRPELAERHNNRSCEFFHTQSRSMNSRHDCW